MIQNFTAFLFLIILSISYAQTQLVTGKIIDDTGTPAAGANLTLYTAQNVYDAESDSLGIFKFFITSVTSADENHLPSGYAVSDNFPNPFNPTTRIGVTLPARGKVKVEIYNLLGETVVPNIEQTFNPGTSYIDVELNGLSNGIYFSRITIDDKFTAVRKMMLVYGSQHLNSGTGVQMPKPTDSSLEVILDSLVVWTTFAAKTFTNLPVLNTDTLDLGILVIETGACPPVVNYAGRTYTTVQIGEQCWMRENLNAGSMILVNQIMHNNGIIEKYCYNDDTLNCNSYGALYQWDEAMEYSTAAGAQGICPPGWHIPSREEYEILLETVNFDGNALKKTGQGIGNGAGTNTSGFSAILGGRRYSVGDFGSFGNLGVYWTSTEYSGFYGIYLHLYNTGKIAGLPDLSKKYGFSVRCVKN